MKQENNMERLKWAYPQIFYKETSLVGFEKTGQAESDNWWSKVRQQDSVTCGPEILLEKSVDGEKNIKITIKFFKLQRQLKIPAKSKTEMQLLLSRALKNISRSVSQIGSVKVDQIPPRTYKPATRDWDLEDK